MRDGAAAPGERLIWTGGPGAARLWHRPELVGEGRARILGTAACEHEARVTAGATTRLTFTYTVPDGSGLVPQATACA